MLRHIRPELKLQELFPLCLGRTLSDIMVFPADCIVIREPVLSQRLWQNFKSSIALLQHITAMLESTVSAVVKLLLTEPVGKLSIWSCRVHMLSDWYTMLYNQSPDYVNTLHCTQEAVYPLYTIVLMYYAFCLVMMMLLCPLLVKKIACGLGKTDRFRSIYATLYIFLIITMLQAVGSGLLYYVSPYIILVLSLVTLAVYM
ncbi:hypothetical protein GOODEAATRI_032042 [Goodea atripinnis]|uniref:Uncharacterized protein n=1 Tax=Goodea atripinnis TaxID=208336 RepID=A0ABV0NRH3_9TELE